MKVKLCAECPYVPEQLAGQYDADAALFLCASCDRLPCRKIKGSELVERLRTLRPREQQVLDLLWGGLKSEEIAAKLGVTAHTVRVHSIAIRLKMGAQSVPDLLRMSATIASAV